jgi:hypothetical protein
MFGISANQENLVFARLVNLLIGMSHGRRKRMLKQSDLDKKVSDILSNAGKHKKAFKSLSSAVNKIGVESGISFKKRKSKYKDYILRCKIDEIINLYLNSELDTLITETLCLSKYEELPFKYLDNRGYYVLCDENLKPKRLEHRYVMDLIYGRKLTPQEIVHHIDECKTNNDPENLMVVTSKEHGKLHRKDK